MSAAGAFAGPAREPRSLLEVAGDLGAMKRMSTPLAADLALRVSRAGTPDLVASALGARLADGQRHLALCQALHAGRGSLVMGTLGGSPTPSLRPAGYVAAFARAVALFAAGPARAHLLCVASVASTAVQAVAFAQLARRAPRQRWRELFEELARDEADHFRLVSGPVAERLRGMQAPRAPLRAHALLAALAAVALAWWWPARLRAYQRVGLDVRRFVPALAAELGPALGRLGVVFPQRSFVRVAGAWLSLCCALAKKTKPA